MTVARRGHEEGGTRTAILDATEAIMREDGYAAVSSRRVADRAGLKSQLVHYHFGSMDDLFIALHERTREAWISRHATALGSPHPLRALWELGLYEQGTELVVEFMALANHRKVIKTMLAEAGEEVRRAETRMLADVLARAGISLDECPPLFLSLVLAGTTRALVTEGMLGITMGHAETRARIERWIDEVDVRIAAGAVRSEERKRKARASP